MKDIRDLLDIISNANKDTRADYHLTLGELIDKLEKFDENQNIAFDNGKFPNNPHSYRGYYSDLALESEDGSTIVKELLDQLKTVFNTELTGYKGGEFLMDSNVPLWCAEYSCCGRAIIDIKDINGDIVLITKEID